MTLRIIVRHPVTGKIVAPPEKVEEERLREEKEKAEKKARADSVQPSPKRLTIIVRKDGVIIAPPHLVGRV